MIILRLAYLIQRASRLYMFCLGIYALMSWFPGAYETAVGRFFARICEPYLRFFDRFNLNIGGLSFTIIAAIIVLQIGSAVVTKLLYQIAVLFL